MNPYRSNSEPMDVDQRPPLGQRDSTNHRDTASQRLPMGQRTLRVEHPQVQPAERQNASSNWTGVTGSIRTFFSSTDHSSSQSQGNFSRQYESTEQRLRRERDEAESENDLLKKAVETLKLDLRRQQEAVSQTKESATRVHQAMQDKELFIGPQKLDRIVQGDFAALVKNVRSWTRHLGSMKNMDLSNIDPAIQRQFEVIAPGLDNVGLRKFLNNKSTTRYFFQGWVTLILIENLIPALADGEFPGTLTRDLWMEKDEAESLFKLERVLVGTDGVSHRELNDWRAYTAALVSKAIPSTTLSNRTEDYIFRLCHEVMEKIQKWGEGLDNETMGIELQKIFSKAVEFSKLIRTQRANWSVRFPSSPLAVPKKSLKQEQSAINGNDPIEMGRAPSLYFNQATMKSVQPDDEDERTDDKIVQIFVSPALYKRGDADGYNFNVSSVIEPSVVLWADAPPVQQPASKPEIVDRDRMSQRSVATETPIEFYTHGQPHKPVKQQQQGVDRALSSRNWEAGSESNVKPERQASSEQAIGKGERN